MTEPATASIDLTALAVHDAAGPALAPIAPGTLAGTRPDPVAVLFMPPSDPLLPGNAVSLILWGRAPGSDARLVDASSAPEGTALAETGLAAAALARSLVLVARSTNR